MFGMDSGGGGVLHRWCVVCLYDDHILCFYSETMGDRDKDRQANRQT